MIDSQKHYYDELVTSIDEIPILQIEKWKEKSIEELQQILTELNNKISNIEMFHTKPDTTTDIGKQQYETQKSMFLRQQQLEFYIKYRKDKEKKNE
jgi:hypothetical protein